LKGIFVRLYGTDKSVPLNGICQFIWGRYKCLFEGRFVPL
jgi:hypothetical protein